MRRARVSTTVDGTLLDRARRLRAGSTDAALFDEALGALIARHRATEINESYDEAYATHPIDGPDEWGDLASFRVAVARS